MLGTGVGLCGGDAWHRLAGRGGEHGVGVIEGHFTGRLAVAMNCDVLTRAWQ